MTTTQIVYHPGWVTDSWPQAEAHDTQPVSLLWLAVALAVAIYGLALGQLALTAGLLTIPAAYTLACVFATLGLGMSLGVARNEVLNLWNEWNETNRSLA